MNIYLDSASTTKTDSTVLEAMLPYMTEYFGNPSSLHKYGRKAKVAIENSRASIAHMLGVSPGEIFFTSGSTEGNNMLLRSAVESLSTIDIISSRLEHASVYETLQDLKDKKNINLYFVETDAHGELCHNSLENLLGKIKRGALVSLMHANNEIGNLINLSVVGDLCKKYGAIFHTDSAQTVGKYDLNFGALPVDFAVASAHKFHGPKGVGFVYINNENKLNPIFTGGSQERNMRAGTENVAGIVGMERALECALSSLEKNKKHVLSLKKRMIEGLKDCDKIVFNGCSADLEKSLYTILSVGFEGIDEENMIIFYLDAHGIYASAGSACSSGSSKKSRVISTLNEYNSATAVRFSFCKYNTMEDINYALKNIKERLIYSKE